MSKAEAGLASGSGTAAATSRDPIGSGEPSGDDGKIVSWPIRRPGAALDDPLLGALVALTRLLERPASGPALTAGLPLAHGLLTTDLFPRAAERAGLSARLLRRDLDRIDPLVMPCVLLLRDRKTCVLIAREGDGYRVLLPETGAGAVEITVAELRRRYTGYAFFAKPEIGFTQRDRAARGVRARHWFWSTLLRQWPVYGEVMLAAVLINVFALASPLFIMNVYDRVVPNSALDTLWVLAVGALIVFAFDFILKTLRGYFVDAAGKVADIKLASGIFEQVMRIRMAARPKSAGAFANNLREFETLRDFFTSASVATLVDLPFILFFIAVIWFLAGPVALVPAAAVPLVIGVGLVMQIPLNRAVRRAFVEAAQKHGVLVESINGLETIRSVGAEGRMQRAWEGFVGATAKSANTSRFLSALTVNFAGSVAQIVTIGVVILGVYRISDGLMTVGALVAATIISGRAMAPLGQVASLLTRFHQARTSLETLDAVMSLPTERSPDKVFVHRPVLRGDLEFRDVGFTYPGQKLAALSGVSFRIAAGERVGLVGRVGSGKTTIEKLVLGLFDPDSGAIMIDGTDIRQLDPADLRRNVGCVPQDVFLFQGSLRENIAIGAPFADDEAVLRAARVAGVEDFASRHPLGYDLSVGERGEQLSGGQRQAVAIARALLLDPPVLVLDEPTSAMDNTAEARFMSRVASELPGRTVLLVTHRASLLSLVDRVLVMDGGRLVADGSREEILSALQAGQIRSEH